VSGEVVSNRVALGYGPHGSEDPSSPFTSRQLARLDEALTLASREAGLAFSIYVGDLSAPTRAHAEALFEKLSPDAVLIAVSPGQRVLHIVTGPVSSTRLTNRACALAAVSMRASFSSGELVGGLTTGLRMLSDSVTTV
jgi:hypothetical protein